MVEGLKKEALGFSRIVFFVIAAAAPLTGTLGAIPIAIGNGNGAGAPIAFVAVGLLLTLFSVGYSRMAVRVRNAGAFYAYVSQGLGRPAGVGAAAVSIFSYSAMQIALYGLFGFFCVTILDPLLGLSLGWSSFALTALCLVHLLGRRGVELNGTVLGCLMIAESVIVLLLAATIIFHGGGPNGLTLRPFDPRYLWAPGAGVALIFAFSCFVGFEATAIYTEEARDPARTVPLATYAAVAIISLFFAFVSWAIVCAHGLANVKQAANANPGDFWFSVSDQLLGHGFTTAMSLLLLGSTFASILAFHNMIARYFFALGREGILWTALGKTDPVRRAPTVAGAVQSSMALIVLLLCIAGHADPYSVVFGWGGAFGTLGIIGMQLLICFAIIAYFRRLADRPARWSILWAPLGSAAGLASILVLAVRNLPLLSGTHNPLIGILPWILVALLLAGMGAALLVRRYRPDIYARLGHIVD